MAADMRMWLELYLLCVVAARPDCGVSVQERTRYDVVLLEAAVPTVLLAAVVP